MDPELIHFICMIVGILGLALGIFNYLQTEKEVSYGLGPQDSRFIAIFKRPSSIFTIVLPASMLPICLAIDVAITVQAHHG